MHGAIASKPSLPPAGTPSIEPATDDAIERAIDEIGLITDPHRAIDWLSTFPQVTLLALGETP